MRVVFRIISTGGGPGAGRVTRYISERDRDPMREGPGSRPLFSDDHEGLSYRAANRILDPDGTPEKDDLLHFSVSFEEEDFEKLGSNEKERQARLREVIREGMKGMAEELNVTSLTWVAGIHRNSDNPHAHIVMLKSVIDRTTGKEKEIGRIRKSLLPHKEMENGVETIIPGRIGERFLSGLDRQQALYLNPDHHRSKIDAAWERLVESVQQRKPAVPERAAEAVTELTRSQRIQGWERLSSQARDHQSVVASWNNDASVREQDNRGFRLALGKHLEFTTRLAFAQVWYERAVEHGDAYRFDVVDQSTSEERKISELDVHRRAAARAQRASPLNRDSREAAFAADLSRHRQTLDQLTEAREQKIAALGKDVGSLRGTLEKVEQNVARLYEMPTEKQLTPLLSRQTLSKLQDQAVRLSLPDKVWELEKLRIALAHEHGAPTRTEDEAATLAAQVSVSRANLSASEARLENFEASVHLTNYEIGGERWSLGAIDKRIARRQEDSKIIPQRAMRLDLRSLARLNHSTEQREQAAAEVEHLKFIRSEIVREVERRREPMVADRDLAREMTDILNDAYQSEERSRRQNGETMPEPKYERYQINSLEAGAEALLDSTLLREVHELEKATSKSDPTINWEGRALAREVMSGIAVDETKQRLEHFLEGKRVASLNLGDHRTATLRQVEARTLTDYAVSIIESSEHREYRHAINKAAQEYRGRLVADFEKAKDYYATARELASEAHGSDPQFTDKERINLEIYAERQNDEMARQQYLDLARTEQNNDREISVSLSR